MTRRRELEHRRAQLTEIRGILDSMKTLSFLETRKLARFLVAQRAVVESIEAMAADLLAFHSDLLPVSSTSTSVVVVIGAERGFCGDLNRTLLEEVQRVFGADGNGAVRLLPVGRKLHGLVESDPRVAALIPGASVAEEITAVLDELSDRVVALHGEIGAFDLHCAHHDAGRGVFVRKLLPPFADLPAPAARYSHAPELNVPPPAFLAEMTDRYLFASLNAMLYEALVAEHQRRIVHLGGAVQHLDEQVESLARQGNVLRQEEIIEEIEVIMLSAAGSAAASGG